ncbi:hypothetical protein BH20BAC1_BH20BAC1_26400 [soil metagenome]
MKNIIIVVTLFLSISNICEAQLKDSIRTRNDKPGTPQSLRQPNAAPLNHVPIIDSKKPQNQTIHHGAVEHNDPSNLSKNKIAAPATPATEVPATPVTLDAVNMSKDTSVNRSRVMQNGQSNATNPIRK